MLVVVQRKSRLFLRRGYWILDSGCSVFIEFIEFVGFAGFTSFDVGRFPLSSGFDVRFWILDRAGSVAQVLLSHFIHNDSGDIKRHVGDHLPQKDAQQEFSCDLRKEVHEKGADRYHIEDFGRAEFDNKVYQVSKIGGDTVGTRELSVTPSTRSQIVTGNGGVETDRGNRRADKCGQHIVLGISADRPGTCHGQYGAEDFSEKISSYPFSDLAFHMRYDVLLRRSSDSTIPSLQVKIDGM